MKRYLLFDGSCGMCTDVAGRIEDLAEGWLEVRPLDDPEMRALDSDLARRPTLLIIDEDRVRSHVGASMAARLVAGLGPRKAAGIASLVNSSTLPATVPGRRALLKGTGLGVLLALSGTQVSVAADESGGGHLLSGDAASVAVREALASVQASTLLQRLGEWKYDVAPVGTVALYGSSGTLVLAFFSRADRSSDHAGVMVCDTSPTGAVKVSFEEVYAKPDELVWEERLQPAALDTQRSWTVNGDSEVEPAGVREYMACMTACLVVGSCDNSILACSRIPWLPAVLACIAAICGPQAYRCHNRLPWRCRGVW